MGMDRENAKMHKLQKKQKTIAGAMKKPMNSFLQKDDKNKHMKILAKISCFLSKKHDFHEFHCPGEAKFMKTP